MTNTIKVQLEFGKKFLSLSSIHLGHEIDRWEIGNDVDSFEEALEELSMLLQSMQEGLKDNDDEGNNNNDTVRSTH